MRGVLDENVSHVRMRCATTEQREVSDVQLESVLVAQRFLHIVEEVRGHVDHGAAFLADEMLMRDTNVVDRRPVTDVGVRDDAELLERIERPVHSRQVDFGVRALDRRGEILRGHVTRCLDER